MKIITGMRFLLVSALLVLCVACAESSGSIKREGTIKVVTTTSIIGDLVENIAGDAVEVTSLMGTGVDPHLYKASAGDVEKLAGADMIFYNGLHLEGKISDVWGQMRKHGIFTVCVAEGIDKSLLFSPEEYQGYYDPHIWFDVALWKKAAKVVMEAFTLYDPENAHVYRHNAESYLEELDLLQAYIQKKIAALRPDRKVLITAHDAFNYFGKGYGFEVMGLQGISTDSEASVADIKNLSKIITERKIPAVFVETSISPRYMRALRASVKARGFDVRIGGSLYSDSMGNPGTEEGTYIGMFKSNVDTIVESLSRSIEVADSNSKAAGDG
ncbi:MAG: manganese transporter [Candidatus Dadabacteria bacterium]|nr:manganese transporter [Candidatus Dadabacteria bacterium]